MFQRLTMCNFKSILNQIVFILIANSLFINSYNLIFLELKWQIYKYFIGYWEKLVILIPLVCGNGSSLTNWAFKGIETEKFPSPWCFTNPTLNIRQVCKGAYSQKLHAQTDLFSKCSALYFPTLHPTRYNFLVYYICNKCLLFHKHLYFSVLKYINEILVCWLSNTLVRNEGSRLVCPTSMGEGSGQTPSLSGFKTI